MSLSCRVLAVCLLVVRSRHHELIYRAGPIYQGSAGRMPSTCTMRDTKFELDTQAWVASLTKIVTAISVMQIVETGMIGLDDDVKPLVLELIRMKILMVTNKSPWHGFLIENTCPITLRFVYPLAYHTTVWNADYVSSMLLTHTAGLGYDIANDDLNEWSLSIKRTVNNLSFTWEGWTTPVLFPSGSGWVYGSGADWASKVLQYKTGKELGPYMEQNIWKPLGLKNTAFSPANIQAGTIMTRQEDGKLRAGPLPVPTHPEVHSGGCGLYTSATDHAAILSMLLRAGSPAEDGGVRLLKKETVDEMFRPQLTPEQRQGFIAAMNDSSYIPWVPPGYPVERLDHGITGIINLDDVPAMRRKGSMGWLGLNNGHWWVDRESGIAATLVVNVMPMNDRVIKELFDELERAVYRELLPSLRTTPDGA